MQHPEIRRAIALSEAGRNPEALLLLNQLAVQNQPEALSLLAQIHWRGGMVPQDLPRGRDFYRRAGEAGDAGAAMQYTNLLATGIAGPRDWLAAIERLRREAAGDAGRRAVLDALATIPTDANGDPVDLPEPERLSTEPDVRLFPGLFTSAACDHVRRFAERVGYQPSTVIDSAGRPVRDTMRTSDAASIHWLMEDPAIHAFNRRLAAASGTEADHGEPLQILRYRQGQQYRSHLDLVRPSANQRDQTALVYLNDDYAGGETRFVKTGLTVKGRKGDALVFRSALPDRRIDPLSEHTGEPVTRGIKFLASRWIHESRWAP